MTEDEFRAFLDTANAELRDKQSRLGSDYGFGEYSRWWYDQEKELLQFLDQSDRVALEADVIFVGSYSRKSNTWMWSWSNDSMLPKVREKSKALKRLEDFTGYEIFGREGAFEVAEESMAWELTAMAVKHFGALGCYRAPSDEGDSQTFLAIMRLRAPLTHAN